MAEQIFHKSAFLSRKQIADGVWEFRFEKPAGFEHKAGQFVQFQIPAADDFVLRSYSISSPPAADWLEFCIKLVPGGKASEYLARLNDVDKLNISGPRGLFVCRDVSAPRYFVATGTGIAPLMAMIEDESGGGEINLLFGVRHEKDLFWVDRFESARLKNPKFNFQITLSQGSDAWAGLRGRVTEHLKVDPAGQYYLCGKMEMVKDVRNILLEAGVNTKSIHFEIF
ncbi:MAG: FAD-dependent oxidoreductase [Patescibacteria group bacterium]